MSLKRNQMHEELLAALVENPSIMDEELSRCIPQSEQSKAKDHMNWARKRLAECIEVYENRSSDPPPEMKAVLATEWAIAKNPDISNEELIGWVNRYKHVCQTYIVDDIGPQTRKRFEVIASLTAKERNDIQH